jgi:hypothetical protein
VKILFNKKDNALVQMAEPHQAQLGKLLNFYTIIEHLAKLIFIIISEKSNQWTHVSIIVTIIQSRARMLIKFSLTKTFTLQIT